MDTRRYLLFVAVSLLAVVLFSNLQRRFAPRKPKPPAVADQGKADGADQKADRAAEKGDGEKKKDASSDPDKGSGNDADGDGGDTEDDGAVVRGVPSRFPQQHVVLGDYTGRRTPFVLYFNTLGASLERVELVARRPNGKLRYRNLEQDTGYLGYLALVVDGHQAGCRVRVVAPGTPAATARPVSGTQVPGVRVGDILVTAAGRKIGNPSDLDVVLKSKKPGTRIRLELLRPAADAAAAGRVAQSKEEAADGDKKDGREPPPTKIVLEAELGPHPLELIQLEPDALGNIRRPMLTTVRQLNDLKLEQGREFRGVAMHQENWELVHADEQEVVFRYPLPEEVCRRAKTGGPVAIVKRFALVPRRAKETYAGAPGDYDIECQLTCEYQGEEPLRIALRQEGPNGLPLEGWWYTRKTSPSWGGAGARDVVWYNQVKKRGLLSASKLYADAAKGKFRTSLAPSKTREDRTFAYVGVDAQYFSAVLLPAGDPGATMEVADVWAFPVGVLGKVKGLARRTQNTSFAVDWPTVALQGSDQPQNVARFRLFLGPKDPEILAHDRLRGLIEYGWFGWVAKPLSWILGAFYFIVRNYGIAIILLTVMVRGAMFPLGRKAARNAQIMQELAPEIKKINEKYKDDMEKRAEATKELWRKHNFHPLSGCWVMFLQLPIFIGLYRALSVDIHLRQAPLIPGISWCSNLAGPDQFLYWKNEALAFLTSETGWLGPYLNLLPIVTIVLFLVQQKLFTPPATDEQSRMQQSMMKYMMIFFGVMFFKVPSGLCIYFITSSLWGIAERKLLPKPAPRKPADPMAPREKTWVERMLEAAEAKSKGNGAPADRRKRKAPKTRKKR